MAARFEELAARRAKEDAGWKQLLYDVPAAAWRDWEVLYAANRKVIDAARAYENVFHGPSREAAKGCLKQALANLTAHVAPRRARAVADVRRALTDPVGAILVEHLATCAEAEGHAEAARALGQVLGVSRAVRGPRYASYFAVLDAVVRIKKDRSKFPVSPQWFGEMFTSNPRAPRDAKGDLFDGVDKGGVVKAVRPVDGGVRVEFKTDRWKEDQHECQDDPRRIVAFRHDGTPIYYRSCMYVGQVWVEDTHAPITVAAPFATGIAPGAFVRSLAGNDERADGSRPAAPLEVWSDKARRRLLTYVGVPL